MKKEPKTHKFWIRIEAGAPDKDGHERFAVTLRPNGYHGSPRDLEPMVLFLGRTFETEEEATRRVWHLFGGPEVFGSFSWRRSRKDNSLTAALVFSVSN